MALSSAISPVKKTYTAVLWAVNKVKITRSFAIQKMGGAVAVAGVILAAVKAHTFSTVGKAMDWIESKLSTVVPIVIGFLAAQVGQPEKGALREILEELT